MKIKLLIMFLVIFNIILLYKITSLTTDKKDYHNISPSSFSVSQTKSYQTNGKEIPNITLSDLRDDSLNIKEYILKRKTVLLVYSEISCNTCTDSLILGCNSLINSKNSNINVVGVAYSTSLNFLRQFARINDTKFPLFWDKNNEFISRLNLNLLPAIFMIDEKGIIINSFFINPNIKDLSPVFFKSAHNFLSSE